MDKKLTDAKEGDLFVEFYAGVFRIWIKRSGKWIRIMHDAIMPHIDRVAKQELEAIADLLYQGQIAEASIQLGMFLYHVHVLRDSHETEQVENP